jgi:hypothetical protein
MPTRAPGTEIFFAFLAKKARLRSNAFGKKHASDGIT